MELREFFKIFVVYKKMFFGITGTFIFFGILFYFIQPQTYKTNLILNITRDYSIPNKEYSYDNFYRLQADEKFAETIVKWIESPYIFDMISKDSQLDKYKNIEAKKLSAQVINVSFITTSKKDAKIISKNIINIINKEAQNLNSKQIQDNWFIILGTKPIIVDNTKSLLFLISLTFFVGCFVGFWSVMIRHYLVAPQK